MTCEFYLLARQKIFVSLELPTLCGGEYSDRLRE